MTRGETTGRRSLAFSGWIRKHLPDSDTGYRVTDIDFALFNEGTKRFMILEEKTKATEMPPWQARCYENIGRWIKRGIDPDWKFLGWHVISFDGTCFHDSERVTLNNKVVSEEEVIKFLSMMNQEVNAENEVDVCYLKRGVFEHRKTLRYTSYDQAMQIFNSTVSKFKKENTEALITVRTLSKGLWTLQTSELTK